MSASLPIRSKLHRWESTLRVVGLVLTVFLTGVAWVEGPRWLAFLGIFVAIGTSFEIVSDVRKRRRRR